MFTILIVSDIATFVAEQLASLPPVTPKQLQPQESLSITSLTTPEAQRLIAGALEKVFPWLLPQTPSAFAGIVSSTASTGL